MENLLTVKEYADKEGITVQAVYYRIEKKIIKSIKVGKMILVKA